MADYPDWTDSVAIIAAEIMLPIDMQAAYIMMPIDIQAQYVNLNVDIVAQTIGAIDVDIAAASIGNIGIDIKAATIGNLTIDIEAQSVGVYLQPDWQVKAGTDKNIYASASLADATWTKVLDYTVPTGKTFYLTQWGFMVSGATGMNAYLYYTHVTTDAELACGGGYFGGMQSFTKPIAIVAGDKIRMKLIQFSGGTLGVGCSIGGYEI